MSEFYHTFKHLKKENTFFSTSSKKLKGKEYFLTYLKDRVTDTKARQRYYKKKIKLQTNIPYEH